MGIKNLNKFLNEKKVIKIHNSLYKLNNKNKQNIIAIDTNLYYYKFIKSSLKNPFYGFLIQIKNLYKNNFIPIYILDGKSPIEKRDLIEKRKKNKNNIYIPYSDIKAFFNIMNIKYIHSFIEADKLIGILYKKDIIQYCLTDDLDILLHHCFKIISFKKGAIYEYDLSYILDKLKINQEQFIYMCILLGCDYIKPKLNINYNEIYNLVKYNSKNDYKNILLSNYPKLTNKINYIFLIIENIFNLFFDISTDFNFEIINNNNNNMDKKLNEVINEIKQLDNYLINNIPYFLILHIYKLNY